VRDRPTIRGLASGLAALLRLLRLLGLLAPLAGLPMAAGAEPMAVSPDVQVPIFLKALAYDRNLLDKARGDILIGLLFVPGDVESEAAARSVAKLMAAYPTGDVIDLPVYYRMIPMQDSTDLAQIIHDEWVDVLYVAPGVQERLGDVLRVVSGLKVLSITGVPAYVDQGISLGVEAREGHAQIVVNLASAESAGSKFAGHFLSLCRVIRKTPTDSVRTIPPTLPQR
jgi:hypothetical protein